MSKKVVIVEDEPSIVISLEFLMQQCGYELYISTTGDEGLRLIKQHVPDLILLDVMVPNMNGFEICQAVRESKKLRHIKIIMLTAKGREIDVQKGLGVGADVYMKKPFATKELLAKVQELLS